jgi:c-di-GMP-binding flagellar brake protein YcgR
MSSLARPTHESSALQSEEDLERFRIRNAYEIELILSKLAECATVVSMHAHDSPWFMLTTVLYSERERGILLVECGRDEDLNMRIMEAKEVRFDTYLDQVNVRFSCHKVTTTVVSGMLAFQCNFPETLIRLQRREFFRISPPFNQPMVVDLVLPKPVDQSPSVWVKARARGVDISCGGIVFLVEGNFMHLPIGSALREVRIELPKMNDLIADLEVRNLRFMERAGQDGTTRIGCKFARIDSRTTALLQRYINRLQVEGRIET